MHQVSSLGTYSGSSDTLSWRMGKHAGTFGRFCAPCPKSCNTLQLVPFVSTSSEELDHFCPDRFHFSHRLFKSHHFLASALGIHCHWSLSLGWWCSVLGSTVPCLERLALWSQPQMAYCQDCCWRLHLWLMACWPAWLVKEPWHSVFCRIKCCTKSSNLAELHWEGSHNWRKLAASIWCLPLFCSNAT